MRPSGRIRDRDAHTFSRNSAVTSLLPGLAQDVVERIETPVVTLEQAIAEHGVPRFCELDVEGYEPEVPPA